MEEQMQTTPELSGISAEATGNETTGAVSGETLFEQYENGASVDELNELLAQKDGVSGETQTDIETRTDGPNEDKKAERESAGEEDNTNENSRETVQETTNNKRQERTFTQRDVDYMIGKKTRDLTKKHSSLIDDLSVLLGISRDEVTNAVRKQRYEAEAEAAGVADKDLYAKNKLLEQQNEQFAQERQEQQKQAQFYQEISRQISDFQKKVPAFDMNKAVENRRFSRLLSNLYDDEITRGDALELAYNAVFFDEAIRQAAQAEREKVISSVRSGQARISEGAAKGASGAAAKIDVNKLTDEQIADLAARAANGEQIQF